MRAIIIMVALGGLAALASAEEVLDGRALFEEKCAMCHREMGMGTGLLARRMDPAIAKLEDRQDLTVELVIAAARMGIGNMPSIPRGEASDAALRAIGEYLAKPHQEASDQGQ